MRLLTTEQAAAILGVSGQRVRVLIASGRLKATRFGGRAWMIDRTDLRAVRKRKPGRPRQ